MKKYNITFEQQLKHLRPLIFITLAFYITVKAFSYFGGHNGFIAALIGGGIWYLVLNFIPEVILHVRYYSLNKGYTFLYEQAANEITIKMNEITSTFTFDEIKLIEYYKPIPMAENRAKIFPWAVYYYFIIYLKNGQHFVITSLLVDNLDLPVDKDKIDLEKVFYAFPKVNSKW